MRNLWLVSSLALAAIAVYFALENRELKQQLARQRPAAAAAPSAASAAPAATTGADDDDAAAPRGLGRLVEAMRNARPVSEEAPKESRVERRARRTAEIADLFGRQEGESEADYQARVSPFLAMMLERPRQRAAELRREMEGKAAITPEQSAKLDKAFAAAYDEVLEYTNAAIAEGQLSPYERNVSGILSYAGGLGGILGAVEKDVGTILRPEQVRTLEDAGFEWGELLGVNVPWEKLRAPPPRPAN